MRVREVFGVARARVLRQVADLAGTLDAAARRLQFVREGLGESGLAGTVATDQTDLVALVNAEVDLIHEHSCAHS